MLPTSLLLEVAHAQQATFNSPIPIDNGQGDQVDPHIASAGNTAYMTWTSEANGISKVLFTKTSNGGISFDSIKTLSDDDGGHFAFLSDIAVSGNNVYVVWTDVTDTTSDILFIKSINGGDSFTQPIKLNDGNEPSGRFPRIAVSRSNVYVAWQDFTCCPSGFDSDIFFAVSTDDGTTFSNPFNVSNNLGTLSFNPSIAASGANVHIIWRDAYINGQNSKIFYAKSNNAGASFSSTVTLANPESLTSDIKVSGDKVYVVYSHRTASVNDFSVYLLKSSDGGNNFGTPILLRTGDSPQGNVKMDVDQDSIAITWSASLKIFFTGSTDAGNTFIEPISLSDSIPDSISSLPDVTISGQNIYIDWSSVSASNSGFDVYFDAGTIQPSLSPVERIENLINTIENLAAKKNTKTSLEGPLHNAIKLLTGSDPTNDNDVCNKLNSFVQQVNSKENNGQLTSQQAADLRAQATAIERSLGCPSANPFEVIPR